MAGAAFNGLSPRVVVLGLGPSGRAMAHRLAAHGVEVTAIDPAPARPWTPTYAAWADELPSWLPAEVISTRTPARGWALHEHDLGRDYVVLDTARLQHALSDDGVQVITGQVVDATDHEVTLGDGRSVTADLVLDARGSRPALDRAQQTAIGLVVRHEDASMFTETWFMDWRRDNDTGPDDPPSFLYVVPLDDDHLLLEETCLVGRPALGGAELRRRLRARLASRGVRLTGDEREERVRFSVEPETRPGPGSAASRAPVAIGARGGMMHPATGYSVAASLSVAERLGGAIADGAHSRCEITDVLWSRSARSTHALQRVGLTTLLRLPPSGTVAFFEAFFRLPPERQRAYLSARDRPAATLAAMASMAISLPPSLSWVAVTSVGRRSRS
ncbi:MAG TPA: lycopene cyclase family protein [Propionibacteriaceae bacterium]